MCDTHGAIIFLINNNIFSISYTYEIKRYNLLV